MRITMPENVKLIISRLENSGFSAYAVGGCVRDSIMGRTVHDWDICTSAEPQEVLTSLGKHNIIDTGLKHGTVTVNYDNELYEITTFRTDGEYKDNRRPEKVTFVRSLKEDLARRDFTMNSIAYNDREGKKDIYGGEKDIRNKIIRCVGEPSKRFNEDALRIMRALRFSSVLGFEIEKETLDAAKKYAYLLNNISAERIQSELLGILDGEFAERVLTDNIDILGVIIPEILPMVGHKQYNPHHIYDIWMHTVKVTVKSPYGKIPRMAALLHDIAKPRCFTVDERGIGHFKGHPEKGAEMAKNIMNRLRFDKKSTETVSKMIFYHDRRPAANEKNVRKLISELGKEDFLLLMDLKIADARGQNPSTLEQKLQYVEELKKIFYEQTSDGNSFDLKTLDINGTDIINAGIAQGRNIGIILRYLLESVIDGSVLNQKDILMKKAEEYAEKINDN